MTKPRLLIVEDNIEIAEMLEFYFSAHGYDVVVAHDGERAIKMSRSELPSLVLLDIGLPDIDGFTVCRHLRQTMRTKHLPVIFATKRDRKTDRMEGLGLGAEDYIAKPFDLEELFLRIQNAINRSARNNLLDPRTGLPGAEVVRQEMAQVAHQTDRTTITLRIKHIDEFRDMYGTLAVTEVFRATAHMLNGVLTELHLSEEFLGQTADDSFVIICSTSKSQEIAQQAVKLFSDGAPSHYSFGQIRGNEVVTRDSNNMEHTLPLIRLETEFGI